MDDLKSLNSRGFICGPHESLECFKKRCALLMELYQTPSKLNQYLSGFSIQGLSVENKKADIHLDWAIGYYSRKKLTLWEPAATWIVPIDSLPIAVLQLNPQHKSILDEILLHESIHIARMAFEEPLYEEFLAYTNSTSKWRRYLGPLFQNTYESIVFVILALLPSFGIFYSSLWNLSSLLLLSFLSFLLGRLIYRHIIFQKALKKIKLIFNTEFPIQIAIRLTDKEMKLFAKNSLYSVMEYMKSEPSLRWKQILSAYPLIY